MSHDIRTTIRPDLVITVSDDEYAQLLAEGLVYTGAAPVSPTDYYDALFADKVANGAATPAALRAAFVSPLPTSGSFTYNSDGTIATDPDGNTYTWNADGTPHTQTKAGVTRTFNWNTDGTLGSVA